MPQWNSTTSGTLQRSHFLTSDLRGYARERSDKDETQVSRRRVAGG